MEFDDKKLKEGIREDYLLFFKYVIGQLSFICQSWHTNNNTRRKASCTQAGLFSQNIFVQ